VPIVVEPADIIFIEGNFPFLIEEVADLIGIKVVYLTDDPIRLKRKWKRDIDYRKKYEPPISATVTSRTSSSWRRSPTDRRWRCVTWWWTQLVQLSGQHLQWPQSWMQGKENFPRHVSSRTCPASQRCIQTSCRADIPGIESSQLPALVLWPGAVTDRHLDAVHGAAGAGLPADRFCRCTRDRQCHGGPAADPLCTVGGSLSDRVSKRTIILTTQTLMMLQAFTLALLTWSGKVQVWHVYVMAFLLGAFKAVDMPARQSFVIELVDGREDLTSAIGLNSAIHNGARTLGPALAGVSVAMMGEAVAFLWNGLSFLAVILSLLLMRGLPQTSRRGEAETQVIRHTIDGVRFVFGQQTILILMSLVAVSSFLSRPYQTLMPVFADVMLLTSPQPVVSFLCNGNFTGLNCQARRPFPRHFVIGRGDWRSGGCPAGRFPALQMRGAAGCLRSEISVFPSSYSCL